MVLYSEIRTMYWCSWLVKGKVIIRLRSTTKVILIITQNNAITGCRLLKYCSIRRGTAEYIYTLKFFGKRAKG